MSRYLMESESEAERLLMKSDEAATTEQLISSGLKKGMTALDAGGGAGFVSKIMSEIVGPEGEVTLVDLSDHRLGVARQFVERGARVKFVKSDLENLPFDDNSFDYVFCRFVFEYLKNPQRVFDELQRVTKPRGRLVVGDLDHNLLSHYPLDPRLESHLLEAVAKLKEKLAWDPFAGRKLYRFFFEGGLKSIRVRVIAHHLFYGDAKDSDVKNWEAKIEQIKSLVKTGALDLSFSIDEFHKDFMKFFKDPARFSYSPLILVEGTKSE